MRNEKKTVITVETRQRTILHRRQKKVVWCEMCAANVEMLSPMQAAVVSNTNERAIFRRVEAGELHFVETPEGITLICSGSLLAVEKLIESKN